MGGFGSNEYNFDGGTKSKRDSVLERINEESSKQHQIKHQTTKTNMNLNYDSFKTLVLDMETENHEKKDKIIITPNGLIGSLRVKKEENDNIAYFGYQDHADNVIIILYNTIYFYIYIFLI